MNPSILPSDDTDFQGEKKDKCSLALVMPVYNEEECIVEVITSWHCELTKLGIDFVLIVINDGSSDSTQEKLQCFSDVSGIWVINKENSGHGPTILFGYRHAIKKADWVFQTDSDDEIKPDHFHSFWESREQYDAVFGIRQHRQQPLGRRFISAISRLTVKSLFGKGVIDVNVPYRLMRSSILEQIISRIPDDTFAPNVAISGGMVSAGARILNIPVHHEGRKTGSVSIASWKLWKSAIKSFWQIARYHGLRFIITSK